MREPNTDWTVRDSCEATNEMNANIRHILYVISDRNRSLSDIGGHTSSQSRENRGW